MVPWIFINAESVLQPTVGEDEAVKFPFSAMPAEIEMYRCLGPPVTKFKQFVLDK